MSVPAAGPVLLYDAATGALSWDASGGSAADAVVVAMLANAPGLHVSDVLLM